MQIPQSFENQLYAIDINVTDDTLINFEVSGDDKDLFNINILGKNIEVTLKVHQNMSFL